MPPMATADWLDRYDPADIRVVRVGGRVVGGAGLLPMAQYFGGRAVPMVGIHAVCIATEHRGRAAGSTLMRTAVEEMAGRGVALSTLYPATRPIYRAVGFEMAGTQTTYTVPVAAIRVRERGLEVDRVGIEAVDDLAEVHAQVARHRNGNLQRTPWVWRRILQPTKGEVSCFRVRVGGRTQGYLVYMGKWRADGSRQDFAVRDLIALDPAAARRLWSLLADQQSLGGDVVMVDGPGAPALRGLSDPTYQVDRMLTWMLRVVDVEAALTARGYAPELSASLDLEVTDDLLAGNRGRFRLTVEGGSARVERGGGRGDLRIDVRGLAALYSGHATGFDLLTQGLAEADPAVLARAGAVFAGPAPWLIEMF